MSFTNGDVLKLVLEFVLSDGTIAQNVFHFLCNFTGTPTNGEVRAACEQYLEDIYNAVSTYLSQDFTINPGQVDKVAWDATEGRWEVVANYGTVTPTITHTNTDDPFPNQIAPVMVANTGRPKSKGRKFLMGFVETAADGGDLVSGAMTALGNALSAYVADETVAGTDVLSPAVVRQGVNSILEFGDGTVSSIVGTQRRRKPGEGA